MQEHQPDHFRTDEFQLRVHPVSSYEGSRGRARFAERRVGGADEKPRAKCTFFFCPSATKTYIIILRTATFLSGSSRTSSYLFALLAGKWTVVMFCEKKKLSSYYVNCLNKKCCSEF